MGNPTDGDLLVLDLDHDHPDPATDRGEALYEALEASPLPRVVVDLGGVDVLSSGDVRVLINLKRSAEARRGGVVLLRPRPHVRRLLRDTKLAAHFPIAEDHPAALALLQSACTA